VDSGCRGEGREAAGFLSRRRGECWTPPARHALTLSGKSRCGPVSEAPAGGPGDSTSAVPLEAGAATLVDEGDALPRRILVVLRPGVALRRRYVNDGRVQAGAR